MPVPDSDAVILLSFATPVPVLFEALTELFDAVVSTLQWQRTGSSWQ